MTNTIDIYEFLYFSQSCKTTYFGCKIVSLNRVLTAKGKIIGVIHFYEYMLTLCIWNRKLAFVLCLQFHDKSV